jgi:hypothetical protein
MSNGEKTVRRLTTAALGVIAFLGGMWISLGGFTTPVAAVVGTNEQINFQGRLFNAQGAVVPDGFYNLQFKIYQDGTGQTAGNPGGTLKWTESFLNNNGQGVQVKNGYMSVELGSVNAFGTQVDWNQSVLWLSMNIGSTNATCASFAACSPDGEMVPMKRLSSSVYSLNSANANKLGGLTSAGFIQNQNVAAQTTANFWIDGAGRANTLQAATSVNTPALRSIADSTTGIQVQNTAGTTTIMNIDTQNARVGIGTTAPSSKLHVATNDSVTNNAQLLVEQQGSGDATLALKTMNETWNIGADASDGSTLKISSATASNTYSSVGNTTIGSTNDQSDNNAINAARFTAGSTGSVMSLSVYVACTISPSPNNQFTMGLYTSNGGGTAPQTLLTQASGTLTTGWNQISVPAATVNSGTNYWITYNSNGTNVNHNCFRKNNSGGQMVWSNTYAYGAMPTTWPGSAGNDTANPSMFAKVLVSSATDNLGNPILQMTSTGRTAFRNNLDSLSALQIQNAAGTSVFNIDTTNGYTGIGSGAAVPTATLQVAGTLTSAGGNISLNDSSNFTVSIGGGTTTGAVTVGNGANTTNLGSNTVNLGNGTGATTLQKTTQTTTNTAGAGLTIRGATGNGTGAGGLVTIQGGQGGATNANGGNLQLSGGASTGTGVSGLVVLNTPTYSTASTQTSGSSVNVTQSNIDSFGTIILNASSAGINYTMGSPTLGASAAGRLIYVTAANGSADFTLRANVGGGIGVEQNIAMRQNTTATMIWNGSQWTAAGASSSTTLQAAYDNTLTSAGGAELLLSNGANANGLTIRDSSTNPVNGTLLEVQNSSAANLFSVNSNVTEYASNAGAETAGSSATTFPSGTWDQTAAGATVTRNNVAGNYVATGQASVMVSTAATNNIGVKNTLSAALTANTTYNVSFTTRQASGTLNTLNVYYSNTGSGVDQECTSSATSLTSVWSKVNCTFTTGASGITAGNAIFIRQSGAAARVFYIDNLSVTIAADYNFATDGNVSDNANFATNWLTAGLGTVNVTRNTGDGYNASDSAQAQITTSTANAGIRNKLRSNPLPSTLYRMTAYARVSSGTFSDFKIRYSRDGSTTAGGNYVDCVDYNTQTIVTTGWTKITCYIQTDATAATNPHVYFVQTAAATRTFMVDAFNMSLRTATTPNVQIGGGVNGGPTTLLTLDKGASAPIASDNDALLGSMYYDTTLGKLQCYEADGWGACGSSPDNVVTISPEYTNAVMHGTGVGTMTSDFCSSAAGININDGTSGQPTICGSNETFNFYKWTSPQSTSQTYSIYVTYQLPSTFKEFASGQTSLGGRISSTTNSNVSYQVYRSNPTTGLTACSSPVAINTASPNTWQTLVATGAADPSTCGFIPSDSIVFKINMSANNTANAYVSNLNFTFSNR